MIVINSAMMQDNIKEFVENYDSSIHFIKKQGISLQFVSADNKKLAIELKKAIKADNRFKALFFNVEAK